MCNQRLLKRVFICYCIGPQALRLDDFKVAHVEKENATDGKQVAEAWNDNKDVKVLRLEA